jgi:hypothetical protein
MLYKFKDELRGAAIRAADESIGSVRDFHFDDRDWVLRYLVVDTGTWLPGRLVVISPASVNRFDRSERALHVSLTRDQIENSPGIGTDEPFLPEQEAALAEYYGWPVYGSALPGHTHPLTGARTTEQAVESRLRSANEVGGYYIHASDGDMGHVYDFILEDFVWAVRYLAIDTQNWWPGKKVLVAPKWIRQVDWANSTVHVDLSRDEIRNSPQYNPDIPLTREYEFQLWSHYGQSTYLE